MVGYDEEAGRATKATVEQEWLSRAAPPDEVRSQNHGDKKRCSKADMGGSKGDEGTVTLRLPARMGGALNANP